MEKRSDEHKSMSEFTLDILPGAKCQGFNSSIDLRRSKDLRKSRSH